MMRNRPLVAQLLVVTPRQVRLFLKLGLLQRRGQVCYILPQFSPQPNNSQMSAFPLWHAWTAAMLGWEGSAGGWVTHGHHSDSYN